MGQFLLDTGGGGNAGNTPTDGLPKATDTQRHGYTMNNSPDLPDTEDLSLIERRFQEECRKTLRDEALRARELRLRLLELRANRKSKWQELLSPLGVAAIVRQHLPRHVLSSCWA